MKTSSTLKQGGRNAKDKGRGDLSSQEVQGSPLYKEGLPSWATLEALRWAAGRWKDLQELQRTTPSGLQIRAQMCPALESRAPLCLLPKMFCMIKSG